MACSFCGVVFSLESCKNPLHNRQSSVTLSRAGGWAWPTHPRTNVRGRKGECGQSQPRLTLAARKRPRVCGGSRLLLGHVLSVALLAIARVGRVLGLIGLLDPLGLGGKLHAVRGVVGNAPLLGGFGDKPFTGRTSKGGTHLAGVEYVALRVGVHVGKLGSGHLLAASVQLLDQLTHDSRVLERLGRGLGLAGTVHSGVEVGNRFASALGVVAQSVGGIPNSAIVLGSVKDDGGQGLAGNSVLGHNLFLLCLYDRGVSRPCALGLAVCSLLFGSPSDNYNMP